MRRGVILLGILLIMTSVMAAQITKHDITLTVKEDGTSYVEEEYMLRLAEEDKAIFNATLQQQQTIEAWSYFGVKKSINANVVDLNIVPEMTLSEFAVVTLQYSTDEVVENIEQKGKERVVGITEKLFAFYDGSRISLPFNPPTELFIRIPEKFDLKEEPTPPTVAVTKQIGSDGIAYQQYEWSYRRPFNSEKFRILYSKEISLQSQLSLSELLKEFEQRFGSPVYILAGIIALAIVIWYRSELSMLITESFAGEPVFEEETEEGT